ncbi:MAG TPA: PTS sugar transporter subunit IIA [Spirochaetota bacterium]|nr:PTS sugar transporter subunit IIA [Spirochaetota bacterium]HNT09669.1 PTS sugar transporter subunit IIA [Spirochaetota bacterium]
MIVSDHLNKDNVLTGVHARSRWELIDQLLQAAVKNRQVRGEDGEEIKKALFEREKSMSTGIGKGVAIPHCSTDKVDDIVLVLAITEIGVNFNAVDNLPVRITVLLIVPKDKLTQHIKTLANIAKVLSNDALRQSLLELDSPESIVKAIRNFEKNAKK